MDLQLIEKSHKSIDARSRSVSIHHLMITGRNSAISSIRIVAREIVYGQNVSFNETNDPPGGSDRELN
jgi:hypothetical protein